MEEKLSLIQAYKAMFAFICSYYFRKGEPDELGSLLGDIQLWEDGTTADPASWYDWLKAVDKVMNNNQTKE
jgi:hypothetical protein